ncbi:MAG: GNAT family N-acetyltransferase [Jatrophihabitantaceae bacterium]
MANATVKDATPQRWNDVATVMGLKGDPARCWCQFFRETNAEARTSTIESRRASLQAQLDGGPPPGVLVYDGTGVPVGWCAVAPRADYARLARAVVAAATADEDGLWAITCFVVRVGFRRQGRSGQLLDGAVDLAHRHGARIVEAYPVDVGVRSPSNAELYHGPFHLFRRAGFSEVARPKPDRPVMRLVL